MLGILAEASREREAGSLMEGGKEEAGRGEVPGWEMGFCKEEGQEREERMSGNSNPL